MSGPSQEVKERAYVIDPECWVSYSGKPVSYKREMELRRDASLRQASLERETVVSPQQALASKIAEKILDKYIVTEYDFSHPPSVEQDVLAQLIEGVLEEFQG